MRGSLRFVSILSKQIFVYCKAKISKPVKLDINYTVNFPYGVLSDYYFDEIGNIVILNKMLVRLFGEAKWYMHEPNRLKVKRYFCLKYLVKSVSQGNAVWRNGVAQNNVASDDKCDVSF